MSSKFYTGDSLEVLRTLPDCSVQCVVTSPPYWGLRDYGVDGQLGLEPTPNEYLTKMTEVFREVRRVLRDDGTCWVNMGDSYANNGACGGESPDGPRKSRETDHSKQVLMKYRVPLGLKAKDLVGMPWRLAFALQADGWYLRSDIIWHKPNPMPESVRDRPTKAHEYVFLLTKNSRYFYDNDAVRERHKDYRESKNSPVHITVALNESRGIGNDVRKWNPESNQYNPLGRNLRTVWTIPSKPFKESHFATFSPALVERCVKAGTAIGDVVLDPFSGAGTVSLVCERLGRDSIGIELNPKYVAIAERRLERNRRRKVNGHGKEIEDLPGQAQFAWVGG